MNKSALEFFYENLLLLSTNIKTKELGEGRVVGNEVLKNLFNEAMDIQNNWILVSDVTPPLQKEVLVKSPDGVIHLASWRPAYSIFTCQGKGEASYDWKWKLI